MNSAASEASEYFSGKVRDYVAGRPSYPPELVDWLANVVGALPSHLVADVGCGTGLLAETFLHAGFAVIGIEPNDEMREAASRQLAKFSKFSAQSGSSEATNLLDASVDGISVGTAFHWFEPRATAIEFHRILRPNGWLALIGNERHERTVADRAFATLLTRYKGNAYEAMRPLTACFPSKFLGSRTRHSSFEHDLSLTEDAFRALAFSRSYMPKVTDARRDSATQELMDCFATHSAGGRYSLSYQAVIFATDGF